MKAGLFAIAFVSLLGGLLLSGDVSDASEVAVQCPCACDVNGSGECEGLDVSTVTMCIDGDCSVCVGGEASGCDANCDGVVDDTDRAIVLCQVRGQTPDGSCDISTCDLGVCCCSTFGSCFENVTEEVCTNDLRGVAIGPGFFCVESRCPIEAGPCNCDVNDSGQCTISDTLIVLDCVGGDCSDCINPCDLDCDGDVDLCDASIVTCQVNAGPEGDPTCCDTVMCGACCLDGEQPECFEARQTECTDQGGTYRGDDTSCEGDGNGDGIDDACECPCDCDPPGPEDCVSQLTDLIDCILGAPECGPDCEACCGQPLVPGQLNECDINCDGVVDLFDRDILICQYNEGTGGEACKPDLDGDGLGDACERPGCENDPDPNCGEPGACCDLDLPEVPPCLDYIDEETCGELGGLYVGLGTECDDGLCPMCLCDCDADGSEQCDQEDIIEVSTCIDGNCSGCAPPGATGQLNGCDADCDGDVDQCDLDIVSCQAHAGPEGDTACCETVSCDPCPPIPPACPVGAVTWISPPDGVIDARRPHVREDATMLEGIGCVDELIIVEAPDGADDPCCWRLDDSNCLNTARHPPYASALEQNNIVRVASNGDGTYSIGLRRPITPGEVTVITYLGNRHNPGRFESLPADVNGDRTSNPDDLDAMMDFCLTCCSGQSCTPPLDIECYSCDCNHSGVIGAEDVGCVTDLLVGASEFEPWEGATLPPTSSTPEPDRLPLPGPEQLINVKVRYLNIVAGDPGRSQAIRVTFVDLPGEYDAWNGVQMWVSEPQEYTENSGKLWPWEAPNYATFWAATLGCDPYFTDWTTYDVIDVYHEGIVPQGVYEIQVVDDSCLPPPEANYSPPLTMTQAIWGDAVRSCITCPCTPPDGVVGIPTDVTALLDKFKNLECALQKARADLLPCIPDQRIDIVPDVTAGLDAFRGFGYPCVPSGPPPCTAVSDGQ